MEAVRKGIFFPGSESIAGYPTLDVTSNEIAVANIDSLAAWPGVEEWDMQASDDRFLDRISDEEYLLYGAEKVSDHMSPGPDGNLIYMPTTPAAALTIPGFDASGSITVGIVCTQGVSFGSFEANTNTESAQRAWYMSNGPTGSEDGLQLVFAGVTTGNAYAYVGPKLDAGSLNVLIVNIDKINNRVVFRVNGAEYVALEYDLSDREVVNGLGFGILNPDGASAIVRPDCGIAAAVAFSKNLTDPEMAQVEAMLMERAGR
jgi:hypothetical protein